MAEMTAAEYAAAQGISVRRVQAAAASGALPARRLAGRWLIDVGAPRRSRAGRPLSARSSRALCSRLSGDTDWADGLSNTERARVRARLDSLPESRVPWQVIADWTRAEHAAPVGYRVADGDLDDLAQDRRLVATGVSDPRVGVSDAGIVVAHIARADLETVEREFLLVPVRDRPNALLYVDDERPNRPVPLGTLIFDLAHSAGSRERSVVGDLVRTAL
ncbi:hypothetical protein [Curtobacterium sp. CFBP9011]|uniref:hypothetical protein n=1 Tax=Curtobacterium sp. CFBP9011 TaxID=3096530 RepID=UPI002A6A17F5|nr:hypothetical protein [Curtobacterium sp. CFBP9011]MDY1005578.1 hypothetical protein [Curtobacterium sp. CFBP9011]